MATEFRMATDYDNSVIVEGSFGINDKLGRECGYHCRITPLAFEAGPCKFYSWPEGHDFGNGLIAADGVTGFQVTRTATRNGKGYGAYIRTLYFRTFEEAKAQADKSVADAAKRYAKQFAK